MYSSALATTIPSSVAAAPAKPTLMAAGGLRDRLTMTRHRVVGRKVLLALAGMITSCLTGTVIYLLSSTTFGHSLSYIFCRVYVLFALIQWRLVVDLVRDSTALDADACRLDSEHQFACVEHMNCQLSSHGTFLSADPSYIGDWVRRDSEGQVTDMSAATSKASRGSKSRASSRTQRTKSTIIMSQSRGSPILVQARPLSFASVPAGASSPHSTSGGGKSSSSGLSVATTACGSVSPSQRNKRLSMLAPAHIQTNVVHASSPLALASPAVPSSSPCHSHLLGHDSRSPPLSSPLGFQPPSARTVSLPRSINSS
ncbi:hypothetical protein BCR44DRAFT_1439714 [Catenaria anguillulae PL171]|uniref:Transmembrane protein n=1 Tax=Catenaria anguillulae PL171 TaxID=765915 RepID=A0A1Y2HDN6_9FUNG|nr:hypothetical protein BCR44DRAFT_1439714 [Catenaria anguillulae PL171]